MEPVRIRLEDIKGDGLSLELQLELTDLDTVKLSGPVIIHAKAIRAGKKIRLRMDLSFTLILPCSRCLKETEHMFSESEEFIFIRAPAPVVPEQQLEDEDLVTQFFTGEEIDIAPLIRETIILSVPIKPLCKPDCKGLCPVCGADRNEEECEHGNSESSFDLRWSKLRELRDRKE
ncbi:MAG: DUF177 domain-containing protein [candidate division WOR-3 bacterium]